jgi:hypothetical protein
MDKENNAYCSEPIENIENYEYAKADSFVGWDIHHRNEITESGRLSMSQLKRMGLYWNRPASELIFLTHGEHMRIHNIGNVHSLGFKHSDETRRKLSSLRKGKKKPRGFGRKVGLRCVLDIWTNGQMKEVLRLYREGLNISQLAKKFNVSRKTIGRIISGKIPDCITDNSSSCTSR